MMIDGITTLMMIDGIPTLMPVVIIIVSSNPSINQPMGKGHLCSRFMPHDNEKNVPVSTLKQIGRSDHATLVLKVLFTCSVWKLRVHLDSSFGWGQILFQRQQIVFSDSPKLPYVGAPHFESCSITPINGTCGKIRK